ncbi:hypothetical protein [Actinocrispum wychmicini]|uniref:Uncharacterized protein n=1 Tax=Actinocrispum wychmicini TaxID=1213861 RepID=A0A4V2S558_9PSEU|nr:hypothetical protein [Actinocrispum wychmicini]TCO50870.1 hypothetical protein EV192_113251 [Actinocrispum wychmicini]
MTNRRLIDLTALSTVFPHEVAPAAALVHLGLPAATIKGNCAPSGPWQRLYPGVVQLTNTAPTRRQKVQGALLYIGGSIVTGPDALALHGVRMSTVNERIHLLVPRNHRVRGITTIRVERTPTPPRPMMRQGLLVAPLARAAMDTARRMTAYQEVFTLFKEVVFQHGVRLDELHNELVVGGGRAPLPKRALHEIGVRIHADVTRSAQLLVQRAGLPPPQWDVPVADPAGNPLGTVTGTWEDIGLAWDVHSFDFDPLPASYPTALKRGSLLAAQGLRVVHTAATQIRASPDTVIDDLRAAHRQASPELAVCGT